MKNWHAYAILWLLSDLVYAVRSLRLLPPDSYERATFLVLIISAAFFIAAARSWAKDR